MDTKKKPIPKKLSTLHLDDPRHFRSSQLHLSIYKLAESFRVCFAEFQSISPKALKSNPEEEFEVCVFAYCISHSCTLVQTAESLELQIF